MKPKVISIHVQELSRVHAKSAVFWERILREWESGKDIMRSRYAPLRSALNLAIRDVSLGRKALERGLSKLSDSNATVKAKSRQAFEIFCEHYLPEIECVLDDYINRPSGTQTIQFGSVLLQGSFHARVKLKNGKAVLIYFHPSEWDEDHQSAFVELLAVLAKHAHGMERDQVWFVDLLGLRVVQPDVHYKRLQSTLHREADFLHRLKRAA